MATDGEMPAVFTAKEALMEKMGKSFYTVSRLLHRYIGLLIFIPLAFSAATGVLPNHPRLLALWDLPLGILGKSYQYDNWNRFSLREALILEDMRIVVGGKLGIFTGKLGQGPLMPINGGLSDSLYYRDTRAILAVEEAAGTRLYAGTKGGLYQKLLNAPSWQKIPLPVANEEIVDLLAIEDRLLVFTKKSALVAEFAEKPLQLRTVPIDFIQDEQKIPAYQLFFPLHSGKLFGNTGRVMADLLAIILIFLCLSGLYLWAFFRSRGFSRDRWAKKLTAFSYKNHLRLGIWSGVLLFGIIGSGILLRPPLIALASLWEIPVAWLGAEADEIQMAGLLDDKTLVVATRSGWYRGNADLQGIFTPITPPFPVFAMGPTILQQLSDHSLAVGSFTGLYLWQPKENTASDLKGQLPGNPTSLRPAKTMAAGIITRDGNLVGYADYRHGLEQQSLSSDLKGLWPKEQEGRISLYHFLFELHNGRFLRDKLGGWYLLFIPLLGILSLVVLASGCFDWWQREKKRGKRRS